MNKESYIRICIYKSIYINLKIFRIVYYVTYFMDIYMCVCIHTHRHTHTHMYASGDSAPTPQGIFGGRCLEAFLVVLGGGEESGERVVGAVGF